MTRLEAVCWSRGDGNVLAGSGLGSPCVQAPALADLGLHQ